MFDIGWSELLIIAVVAVVVVGPRELPGMLRTFGKYMGQMRRMAGDFQRQFNDALKEAELDEVRKGIESVRSVNPLNQMKDSLNPLKAAGDDLRKAIEDPGAPKPGSRSEPEPAAPAAGASADAAPAPAKPASAKATKAAAKPAAPKPASAKPAAKTTASAKPAAKAAAKPAASASAPKPRSPRAKPAKPADTGTAA